MGADLAYPTKGSYGLSCYLSEISQEMIQKKRDELLDVTPEDIRSLAGIIDAFVQDDQICVVGGAAKIDEYRDLFARVEPLCQ